MRGNPRPPDELHWYYHYGGGVGGWGGGGGGGGWGGGGVGWGGGVGLGVVGVGLAGKHVLLAPAAAVKDSQNFRWKKSRILDYFEY